MQFQHFHEDRLRPSRVSTAISPKDQAARRRREKVISQVAIYGLNERTWERRT
jgi:hypothetical protein